MLSPCPETYSYTLSEAWLAGIPVLVSPLGALAERVRTTGGGWGAAGLQAGPVLKQIEYIQANAAEYNRVVRLVRKLSHIGVQAMADRYGQIYALYGSREKSGDGLEFSNEELSASIVC